MQFQSKGTAASFICNKSESGVWYAKLRIANDFWKDGKHVRTDWFTITAFGELALELDKLVGKGDLVQVEGHLRNVQEGQGFGHDFILERFEVLAKKKVQPEPTPEPEAKPTRKGRSKKAA